MTAGTLRNACRFASTACLLGLSLQPVAARLLPLAAAANVQRSATQIDGGIHLGRRLVDDFGGTQSLYCVVEMFGDHAPVRCGTRVKPDTIEQELRRFDEVCGPVESDDSVCRVGEGLVRPGKINS